MSEEEFRKNLENDIDTTRIKFKISEEEINTLKNIVAKLKLKYVNAMDFSELLCNIYYLAPCPPEPKIGEIIMSDVLIITYDKSDKDEPVMLVGKDIGDEFFVLNRFTGEEAESIYKILTEVK